MRSINISLMFGVAALSALLGTGSFIVGFGNFSASAAASISLTGLSLLSVAHAMLALKSQTKKASSQFIALLLYAISAISGTLACSSAGLIPYTMESMQLSFVQSLDYVWRPILICGAISISAYIAAHIHVKQKNKALAQISSASA
jgi:hypothetical protein